MNETATYLTFIVGKVNEANGLYLSADKFSRFASFEITPEEGEVVYVVEQEPYNLYVAIKTA